MFSPLVKAFCHQQRLPDIVFLLPICVNPNIALWPSVVGLL